MSSESRPVADPPADGEHGVIEVRVGDVRQLFDALDPSPFREKDLDPDAEDYIVESFVELGGRPRALVIHLDRSTGLPDEAKLIAEAVQVHFARRADVLRRELRRLLRRGVISLAIGIVFLAAVIGIVQLLGRWADGGAVSLLSREGLVILGWVAMWRPLEIFLYDWWPILNDKRIRDRLSRMEVRVVSGAPRDQDALARMLAAGRGAAVRTESG